LSIFGYISSPPHKFKSVHNTIKLQREFRGRLTRETPPSWASTLQFDDTG